MLTLAYLRCEWRKEEKKRLHFRLFSFNRDVKSKFLSSSMMKSFYFFHHCTYGQNEVLEKMKFSNIVDFTNIPMHNSIIQCGFSATYELYQLILCLNMFSLRTYVLMN